MMRFSWRYIRGIYRETLSRNPNLGTSKHIMFWSRLFLFNFDQRGVSLTTTYDKVG